MTLREVAEQAVGALEAIPEELLLPEAWSMIDHLRQALKRHDERESLLYGQPGDEEYAGSIDGYMDNDYWEAGDEVEVHVYRRKTVQAGWLKSMATGLVDKWSEDFNEEYGAPETYGEEDHGAREQDLMRVLLAWSERAEIYQCEPTGEVIRVRITEDGYDVLG